MSLQHDYATLPPIIWVYINLVGLDASQRVLSLEKCHERCSQKENGSSLLLCKTGKTHQPLQDNKTLRAIVNLNTGKSHSLS